MRISHVLLWAALVQPAAAQTALTLEQAVKAALRNHPQLQSAQYLEQAAAQVPVEVRSQLHPLVYGSVSGAMAEDNNTRILAGGLNNPVIYNRIGMGITVSQMVTDFGRTKYLAESASLQAGAQAQVTQMTRAQVLLQVNRAYFGALRSQAELRVAEETVKNREVVAEQASALARAKLRSDLDVTFARVNLEEAKLLVSNAQNEAKSAMADLSAAMGEPTAKEYALAEMPMPDALPADASVFLEEAARARPEVREARLRVDAARAALEAEKALRYPVIRAVGTAGAAPVHNSRLQDHYVAAGFNIDVPLLNGGLYAARRAEAESRRLAADQAARDLLNRVSRDVTVAYLAAVNAFQRLQLTAQLLDQADQSLKLADARYRLGLSNIVELTQAQLNVTRAQIAQTSARFEYQGQRAVLDYQRGRLQ